MFSEMDGNVLSLLISMELKQYFKKYTKNTASTITHTEGKYKERDIFWSVPVQREDA